jgi:GR25 family glycosyltransferase involved in LPS biosynthesis
MNNNPITYLPNIKVINLKRRPDRKDAMNALFKSIDFTEYEFIQAVDGKEIIVTNEIKTLFNGNDFGNRSGVIGCAMSHYTLWKSLLEDKKTDYYVIFEDDVRLSSNFKNVYKKLQIENIFSMANYLFLGYHMYKHNRELTADAYVKESNSITIDDMQNSLNIGAGFAYSINKNGARILLEYIANNGIKHGIDYIVKICDKLAPSEIRPQIVFSEWYEFADQTIDTDIQKDRNSIDFNIQINTDDENFSFFPMVDHINDDLFMSKLSLEELKKKALDDCNCVGFNTLGFFKSNIDISKLKNSPYFGNNDGIYIKNSFLSRKNKIPRIKLIGNWQLSQKMVEEFGIMSHDDLQLVSNEDEVDYYVIVNYPNHYETYIPDKTIIFQMEPWVFDETKNWGVKTWGAWAKPDTSLFLHVHSHSHYLNPAQWTFDIDSKQISQKKNQITSILSHKNNDIGHHLRIQFAKALQNIDIYGRDNYHQVGNYVGEVPENNKYNVYSSYKYALSVENNSESNYATEKIWEAIVCECLPFYWGCPNLENYIDSNAFVRLPLEDINESIRIVEQAIREDWWSQRIEVIRETKKKVMNELGFFPIIKKILEKRDVYITGCVKNCGNYLNAVFENIRKIIKEFNSYQIVIAYDQSDDNSMSELTRLQKELDIHIITVNGNSSVRCENICNARNTILDYLNGKQYNYLIMLDMDDVCAHPINMSAFKETIVRTDWDAVSFNRINYYDIWALSIDHHRFSCWNFIENSYGTKTNEIKNYIEYKLKNADKKSLIHCDSAFNGFAIYRPKLFVNCFYSSTINDSIPYMKTEDMDGTHLHSLYECEHRPFHLSAIHKNNARIRISPLILFDTNLENECKFVSSLGILQSCDVKSAVPISSTQKLIQYDWNTLKNGDSLYICSNAIKEFFKQYKTINVSFILVTGDCDEIVPNDCFDTRNDFEEFINSDKVIHWYAQNCSGNHPKLSGIPIGLDYHTVKRQDHQWSRKMSPLCQEQQLLELNTIPFTQRIIGCYSNFHFSIEGARFGFDRKDAMNNVPKELVFYEPSKCPRLESWKNQVKYAFVLSPHGNGLDCHRTWEALCLGCIPIVKKSVIDYLYEDLPVLIVDEWKQVTLILLEQTITDFSTKTFNYSKLRLDYWVDKINSV